MNKTVTINISGIIFHIEEDAYENLNRYLARIKNLFSNTEGAGEIMSDIEARVAELLQEKLHPGKQVILQADVEQVMQVMGKPEDFGSESAESEKNTSGSDNTAAGTEKIKRRLFRDPDDKAIGGVCSGLAAYFDTDVVWIRLAMFILIIFGGLSLWVYIILWMIIPEAKTTADRYAMRGESANINTILKNFKEEAEDVKNRINKYGKKIRGENYGENVRNNISIVIATIFNIISRFIGLVVLLIGLGLLIFYVVALITVTVIESNHHVSQWKAAILDSQTMYVLAIVAIMIVAGIPIFMLIYGGIRMLFRIHYSNKWLNISLGIVWTAGLILGIIVIATTYRTFARSATIKQAHDLPAMGDTIVVKMNPAALVLKNMMPDNIAELEKHTKFNKGDYCFTEFNDKTGIIGYADLEITESLSDSVELIINTQANGQTRKEASLSAKEIKYTFRQDKNVLWLDEIFVVDPGARFRWQDVELKLRLPKSKVIYLDKSLRYMLQYSENTNDASSTEMAGRHWIMTDKGLQCLNCEDLETGKSDKGKQIIINADGIEVKKHKTHVQINGDGINVNTPDENVVIKNHQEEGE